MPRSARIHKRAEVTNEALRLWREREMRFPAFVRRMTPDALDHATGAWARVVERANTRSVKIPCPSHGGDQ